VHAGDYHLLGDGCKHTLTGKGWVHKIKNVANHFPKPVAAAVKLDLNDINMPRRGLERARIQSISPAWVKAPMLRKRCLTRSDECIHLIGCSTL